MHNFLRVQARPHGVQLSAQPSTPVLRRPLPVCLQCRLQITSSRSSRRASPSSQQLRSAGFFCGQTCVMELVTRQSERSGYQQRLLQEFTEDVFIFSLLVYIAHESFLDDVLYKFTYLLTYLLYSKGPIGMPSAKRWICKQLIFYHIRSCHDLDL